jgi:hypothetical protein
MNWRAAASILPNSATRDALLLPILRSARAPQCRATATFPAARGMDVESRDSTIAEAGFNGQVWKADD